MSPQTLATSTSTVIFSSRSGNTWQGQAASAQNRAGYYFEKGPQISRALAYTVRLP